MTALSPDDFRRLALALPRAVEGAHHGHPDFSVSGKLFASLGAPDAGWATVRLDPDEQAVRVEAAPEIFTPVRGRWGPKGYTGIRLEAADEASVRGALTAAWRRTASARVRAELP